VSAFQGVKVASQAASAPIVIVIPENVMWQAAPAYALGLICTVSSGASLTFSVQVTADPFPSAGGNWNNHDVIVNKTGSVNSNIAYPVTGVRLNVTAYTNGSVNLGVAYWP
jgi:hypothetical protein